MWVQGQVVKSRHCLQQGFRADGRPQSRYSFQYTLRTHRPFLGLHLGCCFLGALSCRGSGFGVLRTFGVEDCFGCDYGSTVSFHTGGLGRRACQGPTGT